jgi:hypothetical protein
MQASFFQRYEKGNFIRVSILSSLRVEALTLPSDSGLAAGWPFSWPLPGWRRAWKGRSASQISSLATPICRGARTAEGREDTFLPDAASSAIRGRAELRLVSKA